MTKPRSATCWTQWKLLPLQCEGPTRFSGGIIQPQYLKYYYKILSEMTCKNVSIYFLCALKLMGWRAHTHLNVLQTPFKESLCWTFLDFFSCYKFKCILGDTLIYSDLQCNQAIHLSAGVGIRTHDLYAANGVQKLYLCSFLSVYVQHHVKAVLYFEAGTYGSTWRMYSLSSLVWTSRRLVEEAWRLNIKHEWTDMKFCIH